MTHPTLLLPITTRAGQVILVGRTNEAIAADTLLAIEFDQFGKPHLRVEDAKTSRPWRWIEQFDEKQTLTLF